MPAALSKPASSTPAAVRVLRLPWRSVSADRVRTAKALAFLSPWIVGTLAFTVYPVLASLYYSFTNYNLGTPPVWAGLTNWIELVHDPMVLTSLVNTLYYTFASTTLQLVVALVIALALNARIAARGALRALFYLPSMVPTVVTSILWVALFTPYGGLINAALGVLHIPAPLWLESPRWAMPALILMSLWGVGSTAVIFLAGLQDVPRHLYEQARVDGAGTWAQFRLVTLPLLSPIVLLNGILALIAGMQTFTQAYIMTQGGPLNTTFLYPLYLFQTALQNLNMGYASALAWLLFAIIFVLSLAVLRLTRRAVFYA
jgi:multiple sugar transport system permease protein